MSNAQIHTQSVTNYMHLVSSDNDKEPINNNNSPLQLATTSPPSSPNSAESMTLQQGYNLNSTAAAPPQSSPPTHPALIAQAQNQSFSPRSQEAMSPTPEDRHYTNGYQPNGNFTQSNYIHRIGVNDSKNQYTLSPPPLKKSFCIDALLSKNQSENNNDERSAANVNRFLTDEDSFRKYTDDRAECTPSPEDDTSR